MSKRVLSVLLMLALVICLLPALKLEAEAASNPELFLGGVEMLDGDYLLTGATATTTTKPTSTATGYAYYKDGKLTLYNYSYEGSGININTGSIIFPTVLYCTDDLTIELKGGISNLTQNKDVAYAKAIYVAGDITITGDHDLDVVSTHTGICASLGNIIIELGSGELTVEAARYGIMSHDRQVSINGGEVIVKTTDNSDDTDSYAIDAGEGVAIGNKMLIKASTDENAAFAELGAFFASSIKSYDFIRVRYAAPQKVYANATGLTYDSAKGGYGPDFETFNVTLENANTVTDLSDGYSILYETKSGYTYSSPLTGDPEVGQTYYGYLDIRSYSWSYDVDPENIKILIPDFDVTVTGCTEREMSSYLRIEYTATCTAEPVYVGGVKMYGGNYLAAGATTVTTSKPSGGYAYYKNGVLTLHNFVYSGPGYAITSNTHYAAIHSKGDLNMVLEGTNSLAVTSGTYTYGIDVKKALTITAASGASLEFNVGNGTIMSGGNMKISGGTYIQEQKCGSMFDTNGTLSLAGCTVVKKNGGTVITNYGETITLTNCNVTVENADHFIVSWSASPQDITISGGSIQSTTSGSFVTGKQTAVALIISNADVDASVTSSSYKLFTPDYYNKGGLKSLTVNGKTAIASKDMGATWEVYDAGNLSAYQKLKIASKPFDIYVAGIGMMDGQYLANGASAVTTTKPSSGGYAYYKDGVLTLNNFVYSGNCENTMIESNNAINVKLLGKNSLATTGTNGDGIGCYNGSVNISGTGSLNISAADDAIYADGNVTVTDAAVTINGGVYGIYTYDNITLDNATVTVKNVEGDGIYAGYSAEIKDSTVNIACGDDGIYADDLTVTGSTVTVNANDDGLYADNVTITGSTVTVNANDDGLYVDNVTITGSTVNTNGDYEGIYSENVTISGSTVTATGKVYGICSFVAVRITDSDVIAKSTATEDDENCYAIYAYGSVTIDSNLKIQASTEPNGTLGAYDPEKHNTYDYIKISRPITLKITTQPTSKTVAEGSNTTFSVVASGTNLTYQWQYWNGSAWANAYSTGHNTATMTVTGTTARNGLKWRCKVSDGTTTVYTNTVTLSVTSAVKITTQPTSKTVAEGSNTTFSVVASGTNLTYQWQYWNGSAWANAYSTGHNTATMTVTGTTARNGLKWRCKVSDGTTTVYTNTVTLTVTSTVKITTQPTSKTIKDGATTTFTVKASGTNLTYQWQYWNGSAWANAYSTGHNTATITITGNKDRNNLRYRCKVTNGSYTVYSSEAKLKVNTAISITTQPTGKTIKDGATTTFTVKASGTNLTYQWQYWNGSAWANAYSTGHNTATITITGNKNRNNLRYRCKITNGSYTVYSSEAKLKVNTAISITTQPAGKTIKDGATTTFTVKASGTNLSYQWQWWNGSKWADAYSTGHNTATMTVTGNQGRNGLRYRCKITNGSYTVYSTEAKLKVNTAISITTQPTNKTVKTGANTTFTVKASGTNLTYQWQYWNGNAWANAYSTGHNTATMTVTGTAARNGLKWRCKVTNGSFTVYTNTVTLTVN